MKGKALWVFAAILFIIVTGCGGNRTSPSQSGSAGSSSESVSGVSISTSVSAQDETKNGSIDDRGDKNVSESAVSPWGDRVFTKEEVNAKLEAGLSDVWENYQLNAVLQNIYALPENVLASMENAFGAYKWESYKGAFFNSWEEFFTDHSGEDTAVNMLRAVLDLYGITPETAFPTLSSKELEKRLAENPKIDMSQYATYEDGDAFFSYFSYYGCEVLAQNDYVKIEGVRDITVDPYELINRVAKITNISDGPVYIRYAFIDKSGSEGIKDEKYIKALRALPEYDPAYDKIDALKGDITTNAFFPKDILLPGEVTYMNIVSSGHTDYNSHWYFETYPIKDSEVEKQLLGEEKGDDALASVRIREKSEDIALILKNRTRPLEECEYQYATIRGTLVNTDGEPLAFMPFRLTGTTEYSSTVETRECFTSVDGTFIAKVPVLLYKTDETYARYTVFVDGEKAPIDGKMNTMVIGELFALDDEIQEGVKYSDFIKGRRIYGQKSAFVQPTEAKTYDMTIVVPDKLDYLVYDYAEETDYGGQANYYDYGGDIFATVKFHDEERGANKTAYLNVFDHDGNLILRKPTGIQTCCVEVSPDGTLVGTNITPASIVKEDEMDMDYPANVGKATIFDLKGNVVFELETGTRVIAISHDNKYVALDVNGNDCVGIMEIATKKVIWQDYRGAQIRFLIFSEDDSVLYMGSQECIAAYDAKNGTMLWQTFTGAGFPIDMIMSSKYIYASPKGGTGGNDDKLLCIDRKTGKMKWTFQTGSRGTKLTVSPDETMLFWGNDTGARDNGLYILNAETGEPLWTLNYGGQAAWFTSDSEYVAIKDYGILEVFDRTGRKVATTSCGFNSKMSWFVYIKDDLSRILNIAGGGGQGNSGWLYNMTLEDGYNREFIDSQRK